MLWLAALVVAALLWLRDHWRRRKLYAVAAKFGCSLKSYPIIGISYMFFRASSEELMRIFEKIGRDSIKYGGCSKVWQLGELFLSVADAEVAEILMNNCLEKHDVFNILNTFLGNGSIFAPVAIWRPRRRNMLVSFSMKNLTSYVEVFTKKSIVLRDLLKKEVGQKPFSFWKYISIYGLDTLSETILGVPTETQQSGDHTLYRAVDHIFDVGAKRLCKPWLYSDVIFKLMPDYRSGLKSAHHIWDYIIKIIRMKSHFLTLNKDSANRSSYLDALLSKDDQGKVTEQELIEESVILLMAGSDTSAIAISFVLMNLARYPTVQEKIFNELGEVFGDSDDPVCYKDLLQLKYLEAVIKENLRLFPVAPVLLRKVDKDITLPSGLTLVDGCGILINVWAVHRNPKYWGDDAEQFRPERFLEGPLKHPASFLPFSTGARGCIGYQYGMLSMKTVLSTLLRRYRVLPPPEDQRHIRTQFHILLRDVNEFQIQIENRKTT